LLYKFPHFVEMLHFMLQIVLQKWDTQFTTLTINFRFSTIWCKIML